MKRKIIGIFICTLLITTILPIAGTVFAGDEEDPEITDEVEDCGRDYLDAISAWFYEDAEKPGYLYVALKVNELNKYGLKQHLTVHWEHNGIEHATGLNIGYIFSDWYYFAAGYGHGFWFQEHYEKINGSVDEGNGIITFEIPKSLINNPQSGDVLTKTHVENFQRFGLWGRLGFKPLWCNQVFDWAPSSGDLLNDRANYSQWYGEDYIVQYSGMPPTEKSKTKSVTEQFGNYKIGFNCHVEYEGPGICFFNIFVKTGKDTCFTTMTHMWSVYLDTKITVDGWHHTGKGVVHMVGYTGKYEYNDTTQIFTFDGDALFCFARGK